MTSGGGIRAAIIAELSRQISGGAPSQPPQQQYGLPPLQAFGSMVEYAAARQAAKAKAEAAAAAGAGAGAAEAGAEAGEGAAEAGEAVFEAGGEATVLPVAPVQQLPSSAAAAATPAVVDPLAAPVPPSS